jgi:prepilin-type N-terminal cleavage/methylation domain-containing protein
MVGLRRPNAFTLIELLIVILVIAILVAVAAPSFLGQTRKAQDSAAKQSLAIAYREARADAVPRDGDWGDATSLAAAISAGEPTLNAVAAAVAPVAPETAGKSNISVAVVASQLTLKARSASGAVCVLSAGANGALQPITCGAQASAISSRVPSDYVYFVSSRDGPESIYRVPASGDSAQLVFDPTTIDSDGDVAFPTLSPDGTKLAFNYIHAGLQRIAAVKVGGIQIITTPPGSDRDTQPAFSPDGTQIAFTRLTNVGADIYVVGADGSNLTQLTAPGAGVSDTSPAWSPDGSEISFSRVSASVRAIEVMPAAGGTPSPVYDISNCVTCSVLSGPHAWSPDGTRIAFGAKRDDTPTVDIYTIGADGSDLTRITTDDVNDELSPAWSADGSGLVFERDEPSGGSRIVKLDLADSSETDLTGSPGPDGFSPVW